MRRDKGSPKTAPEKKKRVYADSRTSTKSEFRFAPSQR